MKKPRKKQVWHYDYWECENYIAHLMGVKDLRDFAGKYSEGNDDAPYLDFWHEVLDNNEIHNGSYIYISREGDWPEWCEPIVEKFIKEFGDEKYWVRW